MASQKLKNLFFFSCLVLPFNLAYTQMVHAQTAGITATIKVGNSPSGIAVNTKTNEVAVANSKSDTISVINGETNKITSTINVASGPSAVYFMESPSEIYTTCETADVLSLIDAVTKEVGAEISISSPSDIALDEGTGQTYVISESGGSVFLFDFLTRSVADTQSVGEKPKQIAINPNTYYGYVTNYGSNSVTIIDERGVAGSRSSSIMIGGSIAVGDGPSGVAVNLITDKVYVTNVISNTITEIDSIENKVTGTLSLSKGKGIYDIAVDATRSKLYVTSKDTNELLILDPSGNILQSVKVGNKPSSVAVNPNTNKIYVANEGSDTVSVVAGEGVSAPGTSSGGTAPPKDSFEKINEIIDDFTKAKDELDDVRNKTAKKLAGQIKTLIKKLETIIASGTTEKCDWLLAAVIKRGNKALALLEATNCNEVKDKKIPCIPSDILDLVIEEIQPNISYIESLYTEDENNNDVPDYCDELFKP